MNRKIKKLQLDQLILSTVWAPDRDDKDIRT